MPLPNKKRVPPFTVLKEEFTIAELTAVGIHNRSEAKRAGLLIDFILNNKSIPQDFNEYRPKTADSYDEFEKREITVLAKIKKNPLKGLHHSFLMLFGKLYALDNKKRHQIADPKATGLVGKGSIGKVKLTMDQKGGTLAVKIQETKQINLNVIKRIWGVLTKLGYMKAASVLGEKIYTIIRYFKGDNLAEYLASRKIGPEKGLEIALKVSLAVRKCHELNIVHHDIKINNFIISEPIDGSKITAIDFDSSWDLDNMVSGSYQRFNNDFSAPETKVNSIDIIVKASDIYQLGHIFKILDQVSKVNLESLINDMLQEDYKKRPTIEEVIKRLRALKENMKKVRIFDYVIIPAVMVWAMIFIVVLNFPLSVLYTLPVISISLIVLGIIHVKEWYQTKALNSIIDSKIDPLNIKSELLDKLKLDKEQYTAFTTGYFAAQKGTYVDKALTWLYQRNYSKAYYAGQRWCELNPQDLSLEEPTQQMQIPQP